MTMHNIKVTVARSFLLSSRQLLI